MNTRTQRPQRQDASDGAAPNGGLDTAAFDRLYRDHVDRIFRFAQRLCGQVDDAKDLVQDTFLNAYRGLKHFRGDAQPSTWLYTIATNLARDRHRRQLRRPQVSLDAANESSETTLRERLESTAPSPPETLQAEERAAAVRAAVSELPEDLRTALILVEYEDRSQAEIAAVLECSVKAVEMRLYRARQQLRERLAPLLEQL